MNPSTISINDATPTQRDFVPVSASTGKSIFHDRNATTSAGFGVLTMGMTLATAQKPFNKVHLSFKVPKEVTVDGVTTVQHYPRFDADITLPEGMSATERLDFYTLLKNWFAHASMDAYLADLDPYL